MRGRNITSEYNDDEDNDEVSQQTLQGRDEDR